MDNSYYSSDFEKILEDLLKCISEPEVQDNTIARLRDYKYENNHSSLTESGIYFGPGIFIKQLYQMSH